MTGVAQGVLGKKRFLLRFQDGCKHNMSSNQLTIGIVEKIPEEKEPEVSEIAEIPEEQVKFGKGVISLCLWNNVFLKVVWR